MNPSDKGPDLCIDNTQPIICPFKIVFTKMKTFLLGDIIEVHKSGIQESMCQIMEVFLFVQPLCIYIYKHINLITTNNLVFNNS